MKILIAYDGSAFADAAIEDLRYAGFPPENDVKVVSVAPSQGKACMQETGALAERALARIRFQFPAWNVTSETLLGEPADTLQKTILRWNPDLVVMGSHGRSAIARLLLGSVSLNVVHHAPCSVRVARAGVRRANSPERLLVATDGSPEGTAAVDAVARRSWPEGTQVRVVSVAETLVAAVPQLVPVLDGGSYESATAMLTAEAADQRERARLQSVADESAALLQAMGLTATAAVLEGNPRSEVVAAADRWRADTVFVGARGLGALDRLLLGSVSTALVTHAQCTVEVVRHL